MILKIFQKKKRFKAICAGLDYSKPKMLFVGQLWWPIFFKSCPSRPPSPPNYFSDATALVKTQCIPNTLKCRALKVL